VNILRAERPTSNGKLADAELPFVGGELDGLKLIGFGVWIRRGGDGYNVTFPARQFTIHGERRFFALLRATGNPAAQDQVRRLVIEAYLATDGQHIAAAVDA
jgi:hypothetical protein